MPFLEDGFATLITFDLEPTVKIREKEVTPPGFQGGGPINTTTMRNLKLRTQAPKSLITLTETSFSAAYDPADLDLIYGMINKKQIITVTLPDGTTEDFWGWLDEFVPDAHTEGEQPTAACTIQPSNEDDAGVEVDIAFGTPAPTTTAP